MQPVPFHQSNCHQPTSCPDVFQIKEEGFAYEMDVPLTGCNELVGLLTLPTKR